MNSDFDTLFPDVRESGETRHRQSQLVMLRLLKIFHYLCEKHGIKYFLVGGSLLGAIRHKGFIPWDDDLDIGMTRNEYEKFMKLAAPELPYDIFFQTQKTDPYYPVHHEVEAKLRDKYSSNIRKAGLEKIYRWHNGIQLDIFVYDCAFLPHNAFIYLINKSFLQFSRQNRHGNKRTGVLKAISKYAPFPLVYASSYINKRWMIRLGANYIRREEIAELEKVPFEDMEVYVPQGWDACLKRQYGDYMKPPPANKQKGHHSVVPPDPFTPCEHSEILYWKDRKLRNGQAVSSEKVGNGLENAGL